MSDSTATETLETVIADVPDDYTWLVRSDEGGKFFANLMRKNFIPVLDHPTQAGTMFPSRGETAAAALRTAVTTCLMYKRGEAKWAESVPRHT